MGVRVVGDPRIFKSDDLGRGDEFLRSEFRRNWPVRRTDDDPAADDPQLF